MRKGAQDGESSTRNAHSPPIESKISSGSASPIGASATRTSPLMSIRYPGGRWSGGEVTHTGDAGNAGGGRRPTRSGLVTPGNTIPGRAPRRQPHRGLDAAGGCSNRCQPDCSSWFKSSKFPPGTSCGGEPPGIASAGIGARRESSNRAATGLIRPARRRRGRRHADERFVEQPFRLGRPAKRGGKVVPPIVSLTAVIWASTARQFGPGVEPRQRRQRLGRLLPPQRRQLDPRPARPAAHVAAGSARCARRRSHLRSPAGRRRPAVVDGNPQPAGHPLGVQPLRPGDRQQVGVGRFRTPGS